MGIKSTIIHLLSGYTEEEHQRRAEIAFDNGVIYFREEALTYAKSLNGLPADEWCKMMYNYIEAYEE